MGQYVVSARKYRPDSFESLIGQDNIARTLKNSILRGQLAHAYLFCGPRGVGKTSAARIFAKMINCEHPSEDMEPCGSCESCISFQEGRSYCIHELDAASNNGVDDIKALMDQVQVPPQVGRYSVYIIDEVHMLSQQAFNAFLKTLEEPPAHAIFILATTEKHKILPTILSRCQTYDFNRISIPDIVKNLRAIAAKESISIDDESLHVIAQKADGAMRDALTIFDQTVAFCGTEVKYEDVLKNLNVLDFEYSFRLVDDFVQGDWKGAMLIFDEILAKGFNALHFVGSLSSHLRNLLVAKSGGLESLLELPESLKKRYAEQAGRCPFSFLYESLNQTLNCEAGYKASINPRLHIEFTLMRLSTAASSQTQPSQDGSRSQSSSPKDAATSVASSGSATDAGIRQAPQPQQSGTATTVGGTQRRRPVTTSLSLSALKEEKKEKESAAAKIAVSDAIPADEAVIKAWESLPEQYASRPRLSGTLKTAKIELEENAGYKEITFFVQNKSQKDWIDQNLLKDIENKLFGVLRTPKFKLICAVIPAGQTEKVPYTPKEKMEVLMQANQEVKNIVIDLGLDI